MKALTFDCHGSLVDWETGVREFVAALLERPATSQIARPEIDDWLAKWRLIRHQMLRPYRPWRELLVRSYDSTMQFFGMEAFVDDGPTLARMVAALDPRADAKLALRKLAKK